MGHDGGKTRHALPLKRRLGQASFIAPLEYTALVWGVILDWALWRTLPGALTFVGAAVIIASGVYLLRSERVHAEAEHP